MKHIKRFSLLTSFFAFTVFLTCALSCPHIAEGVPAMPGVRMHVQSDGGVVSYQVIGDEFLNYMVDVNGDLLAFGNDGDIYYADWVSEEEFWEIISLYDEPGGISKEISGFFVLSDIKLIGQQNNQNPPDERDMRPLIIPIPDYLLEYAGKLMEERDSAWTDRRGNSESPRGVAQFSLSDPSALERNLVVIYVRFDDESNMPELQDKALSNTEIYDLVFNDARQGSVANYYKTVTGGGIKFVPAKETCDAEDDGIIRVTVPGSHKDWSNNYVSFRTDVVRPAFTNAAQYINFKDFTNGSVINNGEEISIMFIIHGYESSNNGKPGIWGHAHFGDNLGVFDGVMIRVYCAFGAFQSKGEDPQPFTTGIVVHELGHHSFGFLDLYDTGDNRTRGITGYWSVMGLGSWGAAQNEPGGTMPTGLDAYHLSTLFSPTATVSAANLAAGQQFSLSGSSQFVKLETSTTGQYFLLQPRGNVGYDRGLQRAVNTWGNPYGGLMIYHIDENKTPGEINLDWKMHPFLDVEEAHGGRQHLQNNDIGNGTVDDLFFGTKNKFDNTTDPDSNLYDNTLSTAQGKLSGVSVTNAVPTVTNQNTAAGSATVTFKVGTSSTVIPVTGLKLNHSAISLNIGEIGSLIPAIVPDNAYDKQVTWSSSNSAIAEVSAGLVTAKSAGTAIIRAVSSTNASIYAECTVTVGTIPVTLLNVAPNGAARTTTTTWIDLIFDRAVSGLTARNVAITNNSGAATVGNVSGSGKNWRAEVAVTKQGEVSVNVSSYGAYTINGSPQLVEVYAISSVAPSIITSALSDGLLGTVYDETLEATGDAPITWSIDIGKLPDGLSMDAAAGTIFGTPTSTGAFSFTVRALNTVGYDTKTLSINIGTTTAPPQINTAALPGGAAGTVYSYTLSASGGTPITWSIDIGKLPDGLSLNAATGTISGTPTSTGAFSFTVRAENTAGYATQSMTIRINSAAEPPKINTTALPDGAAGTFYTYTLSASGSAPIIWSLDIGNLPDGLSLNAVTGIISGTPTATGAFSFTVRAENTAGYGTQPMTIRVEAPTAPPKINTSSLPDGIVRAFYSRQLSASGGTPMTWSLESGGLPNGLSLNAATGVISGTPTTIGSFNFTVMVENAGGADTRDLKIEVNFENVRVTGVTVVPETATIVTRAFQQLEAMVAPSNATNKSVTWSSDNTSVASVNIYGVVTGKAAGTAKITVKTDDGGFMAYCTVIVPGEGKTTTDPKYSTDVSYAAGKMPGFTEANLEIINGKAAVKKSVSESIAKTLLKENSFEVNTLPWFEAEVGVGNVAAVRIPVAGSQFKADYPKDISLLKIISPTSGEFLKYAATEADYGDGKFTLLTKGSETPYSGRINSSAEYDLVIFIKDGGKYDLDKAANGVVVDPINIVNKTNKGEDDDFFGGSGCNAYGYFALLLMGVVPLLKTGIRD